ncbi:hypothetical protein VTN31DRAFT_1307 [Thermomyces dupontii]|uniref:uncharacterized protein n=1 Tax=Talaromyces thermophilus TaxID=28565 RepID=UPI0037428BD2
MSGPGVGFEYPPQDVSWTKRDVLLFANSIGCSAADELHFLYELHPDFAVFPTYATVLPFKGASQEVVDFYASQRQRPIPGVPAFDARRVVDGERKIIFYKPLPTSSDGKKFQIRSRVLGVYDKGKASVVEIEQALVDEKGDVYTKVIGSSFYVGQGNWGGPKGPSAVTYPPPKDRTPDATFAIQTGPETAHLYRLNGDYNPLHATPEPGQKMGFGGIIVHGLFSWNAAAHGILKALGGSRPANLREFQARFSAPVRPGDRLETKVWRMSDASTKDGFEEVRFVVVNEQGKVVLSNGRALVRVVKKEGKSKL